jgi:hypothetical protein
MLLSRPLTCHAWPQKKVTTSLPIRPLEPVTNNVFTIGILEKQNVRCWSNAWSEPQY